MNNNEITLAFLKEVELELRNQLIAAAAIYDYDAITFNNNYRTMGDMVQNGLNSRWRNLQRMISRMHNGAGFLEVSKELNDDDRATYNRLVVRLNDVTHQVLGYVELPTDPSLAAVLAPVTLPDEKPLRRLSIEPDHPPKMSPKGFWANIHKLFQ